MTQPGIEPRSLGSLANTLFIRPILRNLKQGGVSYTLPVNSNVYVPFLIITLDTIAR